jgi:hypothetical protein
MSVLYRIKLKNPDSYTDVGRLVVNEDGTGFAVLDLLPGIVLRIERTDGENRQKDPSAPMKIVVTPHDD